MNDNIFNNFLKDINTLVDYSYNKVKESSKSGVLEVNRMKMTFKDIVSLIKSHNQEKIVFKKCRINIDKRVENTSFKILDFDGCYFDSGLTGQFIGDSISIKNCIFERKIEIVESKLKSLLIVNCEVKDVSFRKCNIESLKINRLHAPEDDKPPVQIPENSKSPLHIIINELISSQVDLSVILNPFINITRLNCDNLFILNNSNEMIFKLYNSTLKSFYYRSNISDSNPLDYEKCEIVFTDTMIQNNLSIQDSLRYENIKLENVQGKPIIYGNSKMFIDLYNHKLKVVKSSLKGVDKSSLIKLLEDISSVHNFLIDYFRKNECKSSIIRINIDYNIVKQKIDHKIESIENESKSKCAKIFYGSLRLGRVVTNYLSDFGYRSIKIFATLLATILIFTGIHWINGVAVMSNGVQEIIHEPWQSLYYSLVVMTTLGFGDVVAVNLFGKIVSGIQASMGVILFAYLVTIYVNSSNFRAND
ncbi:MAG: ion channel [Bacteroidales bacterium]|nr:ion channel [Bacteroidales bacterium]